jgi:hypothetical protein
VGLTVATTLTLFTMPLMYRLSMQAGPRLRTRFGRVFRV